MAEARITYYPTDEIKKFRKREAAELDIPLGELDIRVWEHYMHCPTVTTKERDRHELHS